MKHNDAEANDGLLSPTWVNDGECSYSCLAPYPQGTSTPSVSAVDAHCAKYGFLREAAPWCLTVIADPQSASHQTLEIYGPLQTSKHHWPDGVAKPQRHFLLGGWKDAVGRYKKTASKSYSIMTFRSFSIQHSFDVNGFFKIFSSFSALRMVPTCLRKFHSSPGLKDIPEGKESDGVRHKWAQKSLVSLG